MVSKAVKNFVILATNLSVLYNVFFLHNYFANSTKLFRSVSN